MRAASLVASCSPSEPRRSSPGRRPGQSSERVESSDSDYTLVRSPKDLRRLIAALASGTRDCLIVGFALHDGEAKPAFTLHEVRAVTPPGTGVYLIVGDYLIRRLRKTRGTRIRLGDGWLWVWWPASRTGATGEQNADRQAKLRQFARELELSRPSVRREIERLEEARASREREFAEMQKGRRRLEQDLDEALGEVLHATARAENAQRLLEEAWSELQSLSDAGLDRDELQMIARMSPEDRIHRLIFREWMRLTPGDRREYRLSYVFGPRFVDTVEQHSDILGSRLAWVCAMIACGRRPSGLEIHPLRRGSGPTANQLARADGAKAWRARVTTSAPNTASASRLHFWTDVSGRVEFGSVGNHDDFSIPGA